MTPLTIIGILIHAAILGLIIAIISGCVIHLAFKLLMSRR